VAASRTSRPTATPAAPVSRPAARTTVDTVFRRQRIQGTSTAASVSGVSKPAARVPSIASFRKAIQTTEEEAQRLQDEINKDSESVTIEEKSVADLDEEIQQLEKEYEASRKDKIDYASKSNSLQTRLGLYEKEEADLNAGLGRLHSELAEIRQNIINCQTERQNFENSLQVLSNTNESLSKTICEKRKALQEQNDLFTKLQADSLSIDRKKRELALKIQRMRGTIPVYCLVSIPESSGLIAYPSQFDERMITIRPGQSTSLDFSFDKVFHAEKPQEAVVKELGFALSGLNRDYSVCLIIYVDFIDSSIVCAIDLQSSCI